MDEIEVINSVNEDLLKKLFLNGALNNEHLSTILNSLEKKKSRSEKKSKKKEKLLATGDKIALLPSVDSISYAENCGVWPQLALSEKKLEHFSPASDNPVFKDSRFRFCKAVLRGLSVAEMAKVFPAHNWNSHAKDKTKGVPGYYLVSWENPLVNLPLAMEKEFWPEKCYRLDFNLTVELFLTLIGLNKKVPDLFYRTTEINGRGQELCVGYQTGKICFVTEEQARKEEKMGICLVKEEAWIK